MEGSIIHPGAINKTAGQKWPIFPNHQSLLLNMLPTLVETHHAIAFYEHRFHNTRNHLGISISTDLKKMVRLFDNF